MTCLLTRLAANIAALPDRTLVACLSDRPGGGSVEITIDEHPEHTVFRPSGELDASNVDAVRSALGGVVGAPVVVLELGEVAFMDSAGLGCLIGAIRRVREAGGEVAVASSRPQLTRLLRTSGFDRIVPVEESVDHALAAMRRGPALG